MTSRFGTNTNLRTVFPARAAFTFSSASARARTSASPAVAGAAAEASLEGAVVSVSAAPILAGTGRLPTYRLGLTAQLQLLKGGQPLSQVTVTQTEDFASGADVLLTESNRGAALRRLVEAVAREAFERL